MYLQCICYWLLSHLEGVLVLDCHSITLLCSSNLILHNSDPKCKSSDAKEAPRHKMWKERLTLVLWGNAAGHVGKTEYTVSLGLSVVSGIHWGRGSLTYFPGIKEDHYT